MIKFGFCSHRFGLTVVIFFILVGDSLQGAVRAPCSTRAASYTWNFEAHTQSLKIYYPTVNEVNSDDFTISSPLDRTILGVDLRHKKNNNFLPKSLVRTFPDLIAFTLWDCPVTCKRKLFQRFVEAQISEFGCQQN